MARIRATERAGAYRITIHGPLEASDLRRLERVCGRALEREVPPLAIVLDALALDPIAKAYLERLRARGATIRLRSSDLA
jgi:hypothetical protein